MLSLIVILGLVAHYITYVITRSSFPPVYWGRERLRDRFGPDSSLTYLASCTWCAAWYVSAVIVLVAATWKSVPWPLAVWPAVAGFVGALTELTEGSRP